MILLAFLKEHSGVGRKTGVGGKPRGEARDQSGSS